jgi:low affinity Fe/Cu permease
MVAVLPVLISPGDILKALVSNVAGNGVTTGVVVVTIVVVVVVTTGVEVVVTTGVVVVVTTGVEVVVTTGVVVVVATDELAGTP